MSTIAEIGSLPFTGERVVPGAVESDLWNEHVSRYRFAALFAPARQVLDVGCGTGYGAQILAERAPQTIGIDLSSDATAFAASHFSGPEFLTASATELPFDASRFGLVTAFEVIEHLEEWPLLLNEVARVLAPDGIVLISTPNKRAYAEARGDAGPNPFHAHEFELDEFRQALARHFPFVRILAQNHQAAVVFSGADGPSAEAFLPPGDASVESHFFLAVCARGPVAIPSFVFVPEAANVLQERERHIHLLQGEVRRLEGELTSFSQAHESLQGEFDRQNGWALGLDKELLRARTQLHNYKADLSAATVSLETALKTAQADREDFDIQLHTAQRAVEAAETDRQAFEIRLQAAQRHNDNLVAEQREIQNSIWFRLGRALHVGPWTERRFRLTPLWRFARHWTDRPSQSARKLATYLAAPLILLAAALSLAAVDLIFYLSGRRRLAFDTAPCRDSASIIIPNWNGSDLLSRFLPFLLRAVDVDRGNEIIVVDNASTDGSPDLLRQQFPQVRLIQLTENRGFAGACNIGVQAAKNEIVVLLNNDMRVDAGFLEPLLRHFSDPHVFAVSSQIFLSDPQRRREETGLTETWWESGFLGVGHRVDPEIEVAYPCAYPGGGSSAFDRRKFLQLGGFDSLFHPFYYEDTDLGRLAWKRGWKVLYEPSSIVFHEHRGTIGKKFSPAFIEGVVRKNAILYCWKNIHDWRLLASHFAAALLSTLSGSRKPPLSRCTPSDVLRVSRQLLPSCRSRWRALSLEAVADREAFLRPLGGYFRDRFLASLTPAPCRPSVLFVSPYPIEPPTHGGAVFMKEALAPLSEIADVHLLSFLDTEDQLSAQRPLASTCKTTQFLVRPHFRIDAFWTLKPCAVREFAVRDFAWMIHRSMYLLKIDVVQIEYTILGQYAGAFRHIPCFLFEHDISVQSLRRRLATVGFDRKLLLEYLRMRFYEPRLLKGFSRIQVCSAANARYLKRLVPSLHGRIDSNVRAAIDTSRYPFVTSSRLPDTLLFLGSFRHSPNVDALRWFTEEVLPKVVRERPSVVLHIVGSDPPRSSTIWNNHPNIRLHGTVPDIREPLQRYAVFICPVLSGSGVRVKLLEAFASGIPAVSTVVGAEGLANNSGEVCELADSPHDFAAGVLHLLRDPNYGVSLAGRARRMVERDRDSRAATARLGSLYRSELQTRRVGHSPHNATPEVQTLQNAV